MKEDFYIKNVLKKHTMLSCCPVLACSQNTFNKLESTRLFTDAKGKVLSRTIEREREREKTHLVLLL